MAHPSKRRAATAATLLALAACAPESPVSPRPDAGSTPRASAAAAAAGVHTQTDRFAYAWSQVASSPTPWSPTTGYGYNSSGGGILITQLATGAYRVDFDGLSRPGIGIDDQWGTATETIIATAHASGATAVVCNALGWFSWLTVSRLTARVDCIDSATGQLVNSRFTILVVGDGSLPGKAAFAWADRPTATSFTPDARYRFNSANGLMGVTHNASIGDWDWRLGTGAPTGAIHLVNAHASGPAVTETCKILEYKSLGPRIRCFDPDAQPKDIQYQVLQVSRGRPGRRFGFAWADQPSVAGPYAPHPSYVFNSSGGAVQVRRLAVGDYQVTFAGLETLGQENVNRHENVQVSSFGAGFSACSVTTWYSELDGLRVRVHCSNQNGQPMDSRFNVLVIE